MGPRNAGPVASKAHATLFTVVTLSGSNSAWPERESILQTYIVIGLSFVSRRSKNALVSRPPAKPVSLPFDPITRWHGAMIEIGLRPFAAPTARIARGEPISFAISAYVRVSP